MVDEGRVRYLIRILRDHCLDGHPYKLGGDASLTVLSARGKHSYVAAHRPAAVRLKLAYDHAEQVIIVIKGLAGVSRTYSCSVNEDRGDTIKHKSPHWYRKYRYT